MRADSNAAAHACHYSLSKCGPAEHLSWETSVAGHIRCRIGAACMNATCAAALSEFVDQLAMGSGSTGGSRQYLGHGRHKHGYPKAGSLLDEEFLAYSFKVTPCNRKYPHDWASCLCSHRGERATRRDLRTHSYLPMACEYAKQRLECPRGDSCPHSHNLFENWLHPKRYKTEMCLFRSNCDRPVCFFAHSNEELRALDDGLPPAEIAWSAGAAICTKQPTKQQAGGCTAAEPQQQQQAYPSELVLGQGQELVISQQQQQQQLAATPDSCAQLLAQRQQSAFFMQIPGGGEVMLAGGSGVDLSQPMLQQQQQLMMLAPASQGLTVSLNPVIPVSSVPAEQQQLPMHSISSPAALQLIPTGLSMGNSPRMVALPVGAAASAVASNSAWVQLHSLQQQQQQQQFLLNGGLGGLPAISSWSMIGPSSTSSNLACVSMALSSGPVGHQAVPGAIVSHQHGLVLPGPAVMHSNAAAAAGTLDACRDRPLMGPVATLSSCSSTSSSSNLLAMMMAPGLSAGVQGMPVASGGQHGCLGYAGVGVGDMPGFLATFQGLAVTQA